MHPFDRYSAWTDVALLKEFSSRPLRKSMRVNTLKSSVEDFLQWAKQKNWMVEPVPWCSEGFFIDREDRETALGKDLLHLLGHSYMQEAASMLPPVLLDPQPGEVILDMSAAPGSKTTQVAAMMSPFVGAQGDNHGVIIANDVQEKRLWTLKSSLHRSGVINTIVTRKVGQWFAKNMTERFDRVLCDAPCTGQGTVRKDSDALNYCSLDNINKMARLQLELLESAIHATKVGGRIVYSTCTLTPEENEGTIHAMLKKFPEQLCIVDPRNIYSLKMWDCSQAIEDSRMVQESLGFPTPTLTPTLRLWPQTYDTEGFFCAVIQKNAPTKQRVHTESVRLHEEEVPRSRQKSIGSQLEERYGSSFLAEGDVLFQRGDQLLLTTLDIANFRMPVVDYGIGMPFGKRLNDERVRLEHELVTLRGAQATSNVWEMDDETLAKLLDGKDVACPKSLWGDIILTYRGVAVGIGLAKDGLLKNRLPRWMVVKS